MSTLMAKYIAQIVVAGIQIVGRSFARAVRTEFQASQTAAQARRNQGGGDNKRAAADAITGMSIQEAKQVLNIDNFSDLEKLEKNYEHLFAVNEKAKGGSFYLQSKIVRAKERLDQEIREQMNATQKKNEVPKDTS